MDQYEQFKEQIKKATEEFKKIDKNETIRLISHLDADGISACSILVKLLNNYNMKYSVSIVQQLTKEVLSSFEPEPYNYFMFTDIGSNSLSDMSRVLSGKKIFVLDHHTPEEVEKIDENIVFVNPHVFGVDGGKEISGAGVVYLFASMLDKKIEDMAYVAVIGAIGDMQEDKGFLMLNKEILDVAVSTGKIKVIKGLRIFGAQTKPLHKVLEYSTDPYIPDVTGSESGAIQFLHQIGIDPKNGNEWKKLVHLSDEEIKKLVTGIIMKRLNNEDDPEDVLGNVYILKEEEKESPTRDAKEFATLLNACGRMDKASLGIGACLGDKKIKRKAIASLSNYKREIINSLRWFEENKESRLVLDGDGFVIINAQDQIMPTIIGTLASILSKSNGFKSGTFIMSMAQLFNGCTKVSLRLSGRNKYVDLKAVVEEIIKGIDGCESGGHKNAAGALIPTDKEDLMVERAKEVLGKKALEEKIV
ncbi:DHH family phosphoesterase [Candidatus Woesearchaeota archaeon]|nr:DHH family phosphoesterase [Candidatus Woesearchaeota archaeon]